MKLRELYETSAPLQIKDQVRSEFTMKFKAWLTRQGISVYNVNDDMSIDVPHDVILSNVSTLPFKFRKVEGNFYIINRFMKSLKGCPDEITGNFNIAGSNITSLEGGPNIVHGDYTITDVRKLTSVKGMASHIGAGVNLSGCPRLKSLEGFSQNIGGTIHINGADALTSLEGLPSKVNGMFALVRCLALTSLKHAPKSAWHVDLAETSKLKSLVGLPQTQSGVLYLGSTCDLLKDVYTIINTKSYSEVSAFPLQDSDLKKVRTIINKYLKQPYGNKRWIECQSELIDAGLEEFAGVPE
jgi:hypothetical protein